MIGCIKHTGAVAMEDSMCRGGSSVLNGLYMSGGGSYGRTDVRIDGHRSLRHNRVDVLLNHCVYNVQQFLFLHLIGLVSMYRAIKNSPRREPKPSTSAPVS